VAGLPQLPHEAADGKIEAARKEEKRFHLAKVLKHISKYNNSLVS